MDTTNAFKYSVVTLSDRASSGEYEDLSGPKIIELMPKEYELNNYHLIKDDKVLLNDILTKECQDVDLIITTGGTGMSSRDITVDVVEALMDYELRGMTIAMHNLNLSKSNGAMFSRAIAAVHQNTLIITLPGSVKAVTELVEFLSPNLDHGLKHLKDIAVH